MTPDELVAALREHLPVITDADFDEYGEVTVEGAVPGRLSRGGRAWRAAATGGGVPPVVGVT